MKFKVFKESKQVKSTVYLKLENSDDGDVNLIACNEDGKRLSAGNILDIRSNGTLRRHACVSEELGLQLERGRIRETS